MRQIFAQTLTELALADRRLTLLVGDFCFGLFDDLKTRRPFQYINTGVAEQSMVGIAAGLAIGGLRPVVYTITPFLLDRAWEQIKLDVDVQRLPVVLAGYADYPLDGPTHTETNAALWCSQLVHTRYFEPQSWLEAEQALRDACLSAGPSFIRLRRDRSAAPGTWPAEGLQC